MDLGSALVGSIILVICITPFIIMYYNRVKKNGKLLCILNENAKLESCQIDRHEFCSDFVLGIDDSKNFVFFLKQNSNETVSQSIDLSKIQSCQLIKKTRMMKINNENIVIIENVGLRLVSLDKNQEEIILDLYDEKISLQLRGELQFADKWSKQITSKLKK